MKKGNAQPLSSCFIDFYGTIVFGDGEKVNKISQILYETGLIS